MPFIIHALLPFEQHICLTRQKNRGIISFNAKEVNAAWRRAAARLCVLTKENRMEAANKIAIITDTCCDLPQEYLKEYPIFCVPLVVTSGTESYRDNIDITVETIYARQKNGNFKTSLPRPQDIEDVYSAIARQGYTHVIVLMIAECLSSANNLMRLAAEEHPELTVKVFDSKSASIGLGALAVQAARYAVRGVAFDPLCELTKRLIDDTVVYYSLDTLEYLQRGGRIGRATALAGGLLQIKPILTFDRKDGMISTAAKVRGRRGVQQRLIELATELAANHPGEEYNLVVCDGNVPEEGAALEAALTRALPNAHRVLHGKIDATLAVHLGPNLLGVGVQFLNSKLPA